MGKAGKGKMVRKKPFELEGLSYSGEHKCVFIPQTFWKAESVPDGPEMGENKIPQLPVEWGICNLLRKNSERSSLRNFTCPNIIHLSSAFAFCYPCHIKNNLPV